MQDFQKRICNFTTAFRLFQNSLLVPRLQNLNRFGSNILLVILLLQDWDRFLNDILFTLLLEDWQILKRRFNFTTSVKLWQIYEQLFISSTTAWFWQISSDILFAPLLLNVDRFLNDFLLVLLLHDWQILKRLYYYYYCKTDRFLNNLLLVRLLLQECNN